MISKQEHAARIRAMVTEHDHYRADIARLIDKYEDAADRGIIPREYVDALHNALDVTEKRPACR